MSKSKIRFNNKHAASKIDKADSPQREDIQPDTACLTEAGCQRCRGLRAFSLSTNPRLGVIHGRCLRCNRNRDFPLEIPKGYVPVIFYMLKDQPLANRDHLLYNFALTSEQLATVLQDIQKRYPWFSHPVLLGTDLRGKASTKKKMAVNLNRR